jgi:hypothetical protein
MSFTDHECGRWLDATRSNMHSRSRRLWRAAGVNRSAPVLQSGGCRSIWTHIGRYFLTGSAARFVGALRLPALGNTWPPPGFQSTYSRLFAHVVFKTLGAFARIYFAFWCKAFLIREFAHYGIVDRGSRGSHSQSCRFRFSASVAGMP